MCSSWEAGTAVCARAAGQSGQYAAQEADAQPEDKGLGGVQRLHMLLRSRPHVVH